MPYLSFFFREPVGTRNRDQGGGPRNIDSGHVNQFVGCQIRQ
jgi:hypothetical protein